VRRGAVGAYSAEEVWCGEGGVPLPIEGGVWRGVRPIPQKILISVISKIVTSQ